ncbi:hypothetical protein PIB30_064739, partial [Stylosanthes scabra]|nr:hypothetical protein [Stylosanthes scabra]
SWLTQLDPKCYSNPTPPFFYQINIPAYCSPFSLCCCTFKHGTKILLPLTEMIEHEFESTRLLLIIAHAALLPRVFSGYIQHLTNTKLRCRRGNHGCRDNWRADAVVGSRAKTTVELMTQQVHDQGAVRRCQ